MLHVKKTLFKTIWKKIQDLRFLGQSNPDEFRAILSLIIVDDLYDWADYLEDAQSVQKFLKDWRTNHIIKNCFYEKVYSNDMFYTNVNTPQTNHTFRDAWDDQNVVYPSSSISPTPKECTEWQEDPTYTPQLIYFHKSPGGHPDLIIGNLTIHERMDVYVNKVNNTVWVIPEGECNWQQLSINNDADISEKIEEYLENKPIGITSVWNETNAGSVTIKSAMEGEATLQSISESEINDLFNE